MRSVSLSLSLFLIPLKTNAKKIATFRRVFRARRRALFAQLAHGYGAAHGISGAPPLLLVQHEAYRFLPAIVVQKDGVAPSWRRRKRSLFSFWVSLFSFRRRQQHPAARGKPQLLWDRSGTIREGLGMPRLLLEGGRQALPQIARHFRDPPLLVFGPSPCLERRVGLRASLLRRLPVLGRGQRVERSREVSLHSASSVRAMSLSCHSLSIDRSFSLALCASRRRA